MMVGPSRGMFSWLTTVMSLKNRLQEYQAKNSTPEYRLGIYNYRIKDIKDYLSISFEEEISWLDSGYRCESDSCCRIRDLKKICVVLVF